MILYKQHTGFINVAKLYTKIIFVGLVETLHQLEFLKVKLFLSPRLELNGVFTSCGRVPDVSTWIGLMPVWVHRRACLCSFSEANRVRNAVDARSFTERIRFSFKTLFQNSGYRPFERRVVRLGFCRRMYISIVVSILLSNRLLWL